MKKLTLQWRITLLTALVLLLCTVALTTYTIYNADRSFMPLLQQATIPAATVIPNTTDSIPSAAAIVDEAALVDDAALINESAVSPSAALELIAVTSAKKAFDVKSILFCVLFTGMGTAAVHFATGKALRPLRKLNAQVDTIDAHTLSARIALPSSEDEVSALSLAFNKMLTRLEDAFISQKRFTSNAAHELKTPLATIKTGIQVLQKDPSASLQDYEENSSLTLDSLNRLSEIVEDLLLLASIEKNSSLDQEKELAPVSLDTLMDAIQWELEAQLDAKHIQFTVNCNEICLLGDSSLLYRVFYNLIENSCKYIQPQGLIQVSANVKGEQIQISVIDNGPGIPLHHQPYIFDAFYRVDDSRSRNAGGSGLGLSIVRTIVESCNGSISVESIPDHGCQFHLFFSSNLLTKI